MFLPTSYRTIHVSTPDQLSSPAQARYFYDSPIWNPKMICLSTFILLISCFYSPLAHAKNNGGERLVATHGEWQVICAKPIGAKTEKCGAVSKVKAADIPDVGLIITFMKAGRNDTTLLSVRAPLGILLLNGLGLKIDDKNVGSVDFIRCTMSGCIANVFMDKKLEKKFKNGNTAMFIIFKTPEQGIAIPISLKGLSKAYAAMK